MVWTITTSLVDGMPAESARNTLDRFIDTFRALDEAGFERFLSADIVAFLPCEDDDLRRLEGRGAVMAQFRRLFGQLRDAGIETIASRQSGLELRSWGDTAMATFELEGELRAGCRTVVLRRDRGEWRVVHLHVSSAAALALTPHPA